MLCVTKSRFGPTPPPQSLHFPFWPLQKALTFLPGAELRVPSNPPGANIDAADTREEYLTGDTQPSSL